MADLPTIAATCWLAAAQQFNLPVGLLQAIGSVESSYDPTAIEYPKNGTYSIGIMQINSSWFPRLAEYGISIEEAWEPCTNIKVGAWILSQEVARYGYSWEAIGAYNAGPYNEQTRNRKLDRYRWYASKVLERWKSQSGTATGQLFVASIQADR